MTLAKRLPWVFLAAAAALPGQESFVPLFNGVDLTGWRAVNCAPDTWTVADEMIVCSGFPTGVLRTERMYENFVLELEWRHMTPKGNAGVFVWSDPITAPGQPYTRAVEVQVLDGREGSWFTSDGDVFPIHGATMVPDNGRGGMRAFPTEKRVKPSPEWNHYRIECRDGAIELAVNGKVVTTGSECHPRKGYICLESEGSLAHFRNLRIAELPDSEAPLAPSDVAAQAAGFESLYTGVDFSGWKHGPEHEGHWKVADWRIDFDGQGKDLWSEREFDDFQLICDWRWTGKPTPTQRPIILPSGEYELDDNGAQKTIEVQDAGDSGIYLRGSSKSQVNIWCWPSGSGEVYGYRTDASMPPDVRAGVTPSEVADAPLGKWNRFVITMVGEELTVVLNGVVVIDRARLPGVPERGPIALQKHGAPIQFANLYVRELNRKPILGEWKGDSQNANGWSLTFRDDGTATWGMGRGAFDANYIFDPTATPMRLDLTGFQAGPLKDKTLFGIVDVSGGTLLWHCESAAADSDGSARPRSFGREQTRRLIRR